MIKIDIKIVTDQTVEIGECHTEVELNTDKTIEEGCSMFRIIEVILGEEILEKCEIIEVKIVEVDIEVTLEMTTLAEVEVGIQKDSIQVILEEMRKIVVGLDQVQESVLIDIGLDVLNVGSMIILQKTVQIYQIQRIIRAGTANA